MRTNFSLAQLADPDLADAEKNLRACVHCGICTATCPTYVLTGDERDGPRGRIVMMQNMLEANGVPSPETVHHLDRCLSCLGCRTACPSGVNYPRLIDTARAHIEAHYPRPLGERLLRWMITNVLTRPALARVMLSLARLSAPLHFLLPGRLRVMADKGAAMPGRSRNEATVATADARRIALMPGCVQKALAPEIDDAVARLLARRGYVLVPLGDAGCCGSLVHHLGRESEAKTWAKRAIESLERAGDDFEAVLITATGCSSHLKDLAHLFADDPAWRDRAARFAAKVKDFCELISPRGAENPRRLRVAYHAPCSLQHGLRISGRNETLLTAAGFEVLAVPEGHLCCGSAGSYSILQPELAEALRARKLGNIAALEPEVIATANIGCLEQLSGGIPVVHVAELLDWAEGGPRPAALHQIARN
ncbi:MAG TPA: glycolate oxidase subunit GlcF [Rhizomicrobium sp.]|nr:glycolate oxidase subunit GlcF [Rhizomicrobium sp.]